MKPPSRTSILHALLRDSAVAVFVPIVLAAFAGSPLPVRVPSADMAAIWWNTIQTDPAQALHPLLAGFIYLMWIAWAWHTLWTILGLTWLTFRLPAPALPTIVRRLTPAATVQALALGSMLTAQAAPAMAATTAHHQTASLTAHRVPAQHARTSQPDTTEAYTVRPGDSLWKIATDTYGKGQDWTAIYEASANRVEPDGARLGDPNYLLPGWTVRLPDRPVPPMPTLPNGHPAPGAKANEDQHTASVHSETPHTVGFDIPGGGSTGITLATAIGAACAIIRRRHRLQNVSPSLRFEPITEILVGAASDAQAADKIGYRSEEHHGIPPMLNRPNPAPPTLGLCPDRQTEANASAGAESSILSYTGAGAEDAARALAVETLAVGTQSADGSRVHLIVDQTAAYNLLGLSPADSLAGRLTVLDDEFNAESLANGHGRSVVISPVTPASTAALRSAAAQPGFTGILLGPVSDTDTITALDIAHDGRIRTATGPRARELANVRLHTLPYTSARALLALLYEAAAPTRPAPSAPNSRDEPGQTDPGGPSDATTLEASEPAQNTSASESAEQTHAAPPAPVDEPNRPTQLLLRVLGPITVEGPAAIVPIDSDRPAAILVLLALNPAGRSAEAMGEGIWNNNLPENRPLAPVYNALQRTRALLHTAIGTKPEPVDEPLTSDRGRYRLASRTITTDLALQHELEAQAERTLTPEDRYRFLSQAARLHRGELAAHLSAAAFEDLAIARLEADSRAQRLHLAAAEAALDLDQCRIPEALEHLRRAMEIEPAERATAVAAHRLFQRLNRPDLARSARQRHERACNALGIDPAPSTPSAARTTPSAPRPQPVPQPAIAEVSTNGTGRTRARVAEAR